MTEVGRELTALGHQRYSESSRIRNLSIRILDYPDHEITVHMTHGCNVTTYIGACDRGHFTAVRVFSVLEDGG